MKTKHTPGPWVIADGRYIKADEFGGIIARCDGTNPANIPLIASAPDLLEALQGLSEAYNHNRMPTFEERRACCAAIDKATGNQTP